MASSSYFTSVHNPSTSSWAKDIQIIPSWLNRLPLAKTHHELYPILTPIAFESFNFNNYDVVISITSAEAKAIITKPSTFHLCYCLTPTRYLWSHNQEYLDSPGLGGWSKVGKLVFNKTKNYLKKLDQITAFRPDQYLAISKVVQKRIEKYYHQKSTIIFPPVDTKIFSHKKSKNYFLLVSRLTPYKKVDLAIKAFNQLNEKLIIVGTGREETSLRSLAGPTIQFTGEISDRQLIKLYSHSQALIMPQEEDFGLVAIEAQAAGKPVIAFDSGGATETILSKTTGLFFASQTVDSLSLAVKRFRTYSWDSQKIQTHAKKFDQTIFKQKIKKFVETQWQIKNQ